MAKVISQFFFCSLKFDLRSLQAHRRFSGQRVIPRIVIGPSPICSRSNHLQARRAMTTGVLNCPLVPNRLDISGVSLAKLVFDGLRNHSAPALIDAATGVTVSRRELLERAEAVAASLVSRGCRSGDVIAIYAHNSVEWVVMLAAALRIDAVVAGINALLTADEVAHQLKLCQPRFIYAEHSNAKVALTASQALDKSRSTIILTDGDVEGCINLRSLYGKPNAVLPSVDKTTRTARDPALIMFSSGTTGLPKAVQIPMEGIVSQIRIFSHPSSIAAFRNMICQSPYSHVTALLNVFTALCVGNTVLVMSKFDFRLYLKLAQVHKIDGLFLVPPIITLLAKSPLVDEFNLTSLKVICCGAAPLGPDLEKQVYDRFPGVRIRQFYGMTETCGAVVGFPTECDAKMKPGAAGVTLQNTTIKVIDPVSGQGLKAHERGEICVKSPQNMLCYLGNPKATAETIDSDEWLHTGDLGHYDEDGFIFITDRIKELIKYNAYQVAPAELESVLLSHPAVADAAVVGVPDPDHGELPLAWVVLKADMNASSEEIMQYVAGKVAPYKKLRGGVQFVSAIPKTPSGKILRKDIRKALQQAKL